MSATGHPGDGEPRSHRVGYPAAPGAACLNFVDRRTGVILNRLTKTRTRHRDAYGVKTLGDQFPQWEGGTFGILQANRSGRCRRFEPTALRAYCVSRANRQCHVRHHSHYDPLGPRRAVAELCAPEHGRPAGQTAAARGLGGAARGGRSAQGWRAVRTSAPYGPQCYTAGCTKRGAAAGSLGRAANRNTRRRIEPQTASWGTEDPNHPSCTRGRSVPPHRLPPLRKRSRTYIRMGVVMSLFGQTFLPRMPSSHAAREPAGSAARSAPALTRRGCPKRGPITMLGHPDMEPRYGPPSSPRPALGSPDLLELVP